MYDERYYCISKLDTSQSIIQSREINMSLLGKLIGQHIVK